MSEPTIYTSMHPRQLHSRLYRPDDMSRLLLFLEEAKAWPPSGSPTASQLLARWARRGVNPVEHIRLLSDDASDLTAYWLAAPFGDGSGRLGFDIVVHPRFRRHGLGNSLLQLVEAEARRYASSRLTCPVFVSASNENPPGSHFLTGQGFRTDHGYWQLRLDNIVEQARPVWPPGIEVRGLANMGGDIDTWCKLVLQAFGEETSPSGVLAQMHEPGGSPDGYFFAVDKSTGQEVGTSRARLDLSDNGRIGYVGTVGVLPQYRRRGIAEALVRHSLAYLAGLGVDSATLFVERENQTARSIYDAMGWYPVYRTDHYWRPTSALQASGSPI